ncbi:MAG: ferredoxin-like protein [Dehalococcoidia bacterium]
MHHTLRFYGQHRHKFLRFYISLARFTKVPLIGRLVRRVADIYGRGGHQGYLLTLGQAEQIIDASRSVALGPCSCRQVFHNCEAPIMTEIVVGAGVEILSEVRLGEFRQVSKKEAKDIMRYCHQKRMMHTVMRCRQDFYAICNCCTCCCVPIRLRQNYKINYALVRNKEALEEFRRQRL